MQKGILIKMIMDAITLNEVGHDLGLAYCFSDPDGTRNGKSGYSFGRVQFDTQNNFLALDCLRDCGFTIKAIVRLIKQEGEIDDLNHKLLDAADVVDRYDKQHVRESLDHCLKLIEANDIALAGHETLMHIVDYHNQFYMSPGGLLHRWLKEAMVTGTEVTPEMILHFKMSRTKWGRLRPDDVQRRFDNIRKIYRLELER